MSLNYAKLRMLEFYYDCVDIYLSREDFEYSEMDTDSAYMAISGDSFEELIKQDLREEFENDKHNWFVTPLAPQGQHTPGHFKVEFKGDKMIGLCSKSYCTESVETYSTPGQVKFSMKVSTKDNSRIRCHITNTSKRQWKTLEPVTLEFVPTIRRWLRTSSTRMHLRTTILNVKYYKTDVLLYL